MSYSKPLQPFVFDSLCYLNRDNVERFSIVCRSLNQFIKRYFHSKPYRIFDYLYIRGGSYALSHYNCAQWHPNRDDYNVQQFLAGQKCSIDESKTHLDDRAYYSFAEMRPYLGPTVRVKVTIIIVAEASTYNPTNIAEMESIAYVWRDYKISICNDDARMNFRNRIGAENIQPILNSPSILQCRELVFNNAHFSFKDFKILYTVKVIDIFLYEGNVTIDPNYLPDFLEQPGVKPIVALYVFSQEIIDNILDRLSKVFLSAILPNAYKIVFVLRNESLTEFCKTNKTSGEKLELKKGLPAEYQKEHLKKCANYTMKRSTI